MNQKFFIINFLLQLNLVLIDSLSVTSVQTYSYHNAKKSNTQKYRTVSTAPGSDLILRRGNTFTMTAHLDDDYVPGVHQMFAQFNFENFPASYKRAVVTIKIASNSKFYANAQNKPDKWHSDLYKTNKNLVTFDIYVPINLPVGEWNCQLFFKTNNNQLSSSFKIPNNIYILFNPWSKLDDVYLPNEQERQEYVLNDVGRIYTGSTKSKEYRDWYFEQFNKGMLKAVMFIMNRSGLTPIERADPVKTARAISAMSNSNDENGVVVGRWKEPYRPYRNPWEWLGSGDIIMKYYREGGNPVKYGQCWVYAGVAVTLARAVGFAARPITAYASAHDTDKSLTIDKYYNIRGQELKDVSADSVWNFHVWVEVWFKRHDIGSTAEPLNTRAENWQAIDSTPQEVSFNGKYELGPTLVAGVRSGDLSISQDMSFVYSEVNSDVIFWYMGRSGQYYKKSVATNSIGTVLVTKSPDGNMIDITDNYKYREGTGQERTSFKRAKGMVNLRYSTDFEFINEISADAVDDVLTRVLLKDKYSIGKAINFTVQMINNINQTRTIFLKLNVDSVYYNGKTVANIEDIVETITLSPGEILLKNYTINEKAYENKLPEIGSLKVSTFTNLNETDSSSYNEYIVELEKPVLHVYSKNKLFYLTKKNKIYLKMRNPLDRSLSNCRLLLKDGLMCEHKEVQINEIGPLANFEHEEEFIPHDHGKSLFIALLDCDQLHDIRGHFAFTVKRPYRNITMSIN